MDKRALLEELLKLAGEHRAQGLKASLSPQEVATDEEAEAEMPMATPEMPGDPEESASGMPSGVVPGEAEGDMDPEMLMQLLASLGGAGE